MAKTTISWKYDSGVGDGFRIYRSDTPMDPDDLPEPLATVTIDKREYDDETVVQGETYYYRVGSYIGLMESVSAELEHVAEASGDEHWDKVVSLLHLDGNLVDETGRSWSVAAGAASYKAGVFGQSLQFDGSTRIWTNHHASLNFGGGDFTFDFACKYESTSTGEVDIFAKYNATGGNREFVIAKMSGESNLTFMFSPDGGTANRVYLSSGIAVSEMSVMKHISIQRSGATFSFFLDGVTTAVHSGVSAGLFAGTANLYVGAFQDGTNSFKGVLDEIRITKGVARYTGNFTPPAEPFPNFGN